MCAQRQLISVVAPAYNEAENLPSFYDRVSKALTPLPYDFEIVIVENGSTDQSLPLLRDLHAKDARLRYVSLSRNFGHQGGIFTGIHHSRGAAVITMDADLQHPPEALPLFIKQWEAGYLVVNSAKMGGSVSLLRKLLDRCFYRLLGKVAGAKVGQADFRLLDRKVVDALVKLPETEKFLRGLIAWLGFKQTTVQYSVASRLHGETKFRPGHLFAMVLQAITSFSTVPLKLLTQLGVLFFVPSALYIIYILWTALLTLWHRDTTLLPPGWATLTVTIVFFGSIQLLALGILGEYIGKIYFETKKRPDFVVSESSDDPR